MRRLNIVLLLVLIASSLYLVHVSYDSRRLYTALDIAQNEARKLEIENERLKSEKQSQATPLRVERVARDKLAMRAATPAVTEYATYSPSVAVPGGAP